MKSKFWLYKIMNFLKRLFLTLLWGAITLICPQMALEEMEGGEDNEESKEKL